MIDFWLCCGHHLLDHEDGGGLVVTDEFLRAYIARPELAPPAEVCAAERTLYSALFADPRRHVGTPAIMAIGDADAPRTDDCSSRSAITFCAIRR